MGMGMGMENLIEYSNYSDFLPCFQGKRDEQEPFHHIQQQISNRSLSN